MCGSWLSFSTFSSVLTLVIDWAFLFIRVVRSWTGGMCVGSGSIHHPSPRQLGLWLLGGPCGWLRGWRGRTARSTPSPGFRWVRLISREGGHWDLYWHIRQIDLFVFPLMYHELDIFLEMLSGVERWPRATVLPAVGRSVSDIPWDCAVGSALS